MDDKRPTYYICPKCDASRKVEKIIERGIDPTTGNAYKRVLLKCGHIEKFSRVIAEANADSLFKKEYYLKKIKKCVAFIFVKDDKGKLTAVGTGFFVGVESKTINKKSTAIYFVTAKHVLLSSSGSFYSEIYIRLNRKNNSVEHIPVNLSRYNLLMHTKDVAVDIALFPFSPSTEIYDFLYIPANGLLATKDIVNSRMVEGDQVFYAGLFWDYPGIERNHPILRFGRVSLLTEEKIKVNRHNEKEKWAHIYLFEIQSFSGNSGSPVFFEVRSALRDRKESQSGKVEIFLVGILKGHYNDIRMAKVIEIKDDVMRELNNGIAMVTPSYLLREILFSDEAIRQREKSRRE